MSHRFRALLLATSALVPLSAQIAHANPLGGQVVGGSATIAGQGTANVTVTQSSQNAIINWQTFNIGAGETTQFVQPNTNSVVLDRVTGGLGPSTLYGTLKSNGEVFLVNPDGVLIGPTGKVQTGGFLATTNDIANADFMAGKYNFSLSGRATASVVNEGSITAQSGGFAALVAPGVRNTGTITATLGTVALASGNAFSLDFYGDQLIKLGVNDSIAAQVIDVSSGKPLASLVSNEGAIKADGGRVELTAVAARAVVDSVINNSGVIEANTIGKHNGMIMLGAATAGNKPAGAPTQVVKVSGKLSAVGKTKGMTGGTIVVTGESIQLANANVDASGQAGGGKVLIGGDTGGGNSNPAVAGISEAALEAFAIPNASNVSVDAASTINASAVNSGDGGKVVIWADGTTSVAGSIAARGGAISGDGGFVETSGHDKLAFSGSANVGAAYGVSGTWLLDPTDLTIASSGAWVVTPTAIETALATGNVVVTTPATGTDAGDITVAEPISWSSPNFLTLSAFRNIVVNANITNTDGAAVNLRADNTGTGVGAVSFGNGATISTSGAVSIFYNPSVNPAGSVVNASSYVNPIENFSGDVTGGAQLTAYMLVNTVYDLQNIQNNLNGDYALGTSINASTATSLNGGVGFIPIGTSANLFEGVFDGQNYTISNLTINSAAQAVGLFAGIGTTGTVRNLGLTNITVNATLPDVGAGTLGSYNLGTVSDVYATGSLHVASGSNVGGLIGSNEGMLERSYAAVSVSSGGGNWSFGGLVGANYATITQSYATGSAFGGNSNGGLVGYNAPTGAISESYASAQASGVGSIGGLVGWDTGLISQSYARGQASGNGNVGGLVGTEGGVASQSYALTTAPAGLPTGFDSKVWGVSPSINNGYPYLLWQTATKATPTTLSGGPVSPSLTTIVVEADPETKVYGSSDPTLAYEILSGTLSGGATFSGSLTRATGENVGQYTIGEGTLSLPSGYSIVFDPAFLTITPAPLTITANDTTREAGQPNPAFSASYSGFVLGQNASVVSGLTFLTPATVGSPAGNYAIVPGGAAAANYAITYGKDGVLAVTPNPTLASIFNDPSGGVQLPGISVQISGSTPPNIVWSESSIINANSAWQTLTEPALENMISLAFSDLISKLPPDAVPGFQAAVRDEIVKMIGQPGKTVDIGDMLMPLNIVLSSLIDDYIIQPVSTNVTNKYGVVAGGASMYAMQVSANSGIAYLDEYIASGGTVVASGWLGVATAGSIGVTSSTIDDVLQVIYEVLPPLGSPRPISSDWTGTTVSRTGSLGALSTSWTQ